MKKKAIIREYIVLWQSFATVSPQFIKYQIVTKLLFSLLILPLFWKATEILIHSKGMGAVSNSEMMRFLFSPQGLLFLIIGSILLVFSVLIEICGFITISARSIKEQPESSYRELLRFTLQRFPEMLSVGSFLSLLFILIFASLSGTGVTLSFLKDIHIPNFISGVIRENLLYSGLYFILIGIMLLLSIRWIFTFHFMVIGDASAGSSIRQSGQLVKRHLKSLLRSFLLIALINSALLIFFVFAWGLMIGFLATVLNLDHAPWRILMIVLVVVQNFLLALGTLLLIPFEIHHLTILFYRFLGRETVSSPLYQAYPKVSQKIKPSTLDKLLQRRNIVGGLLILTILLISIPAGLFFDELFRNQQNILVVGHRGGGGADIPENTLSSIRKAIEYKADFVEIDVQRSSDGAYILQHDPTFKRMAGVNRTAQEMTLAEIKQLDLGTNFPGYPGEQVPKLDQVLDLCRDKIGIFIELKGVSADEKMVDEVVAMVRSRNMTDQTLIMSLDYALLQYVREKYKEIDTGFVYFMAMGDPGSYDVSVIILEEDAANDKAVDRIHHAGKKAVVWTVNKQESMDKFAKKEVDAIITDEVADLQETLKTHEMKTTGDLLLDLFFQ